MNALVFVVLCSRDFFPYENVQQISAQLWEIFIFQCLWAKRKHGNKVGGQLEK
jgi:hypothetical protein